jgi:hypothetical protein
VSRSVLLLDFDNVFSGLAKLDYSAARRFAEQPDVWVEALKRRHLSNGERRWLVLRCYMNPAGWVPAPTEQGRLFFSKFRPFFTSAGFEVVDCPSLTKGIKNAADIKMVIDALDALASGAAFDEFVLGSTDADFTPLLQRLRAHDKRTALLTSGDAAAAVQASADLVLDEQDLMGLLEDEPGDAEGRNTAGPMSEPSVPDGTATERFREAVEGALDASPTAIHVATLGHRLRAALGVGTNGLKWPGGVNLTQALRDLALPGVEIAAGHIYDTGRHAPPLAPPEVVVENRAPASPVDRLLKVIGWPRLPSTDWPAVIETLAEYAVTHEFALSESAKWSRDVLAERGHPVSRRALGYLVRACTHGGADLRSRPSASDIRHALLRCIDQRADDAGIDVDQAEREELECWFGMR